MWFKFSIVVIFDVWTFKANIIEGRVWNVSSLITSWNDFYTFWLKTQFIGHSYLNERKWSQFCAVINRLIAIIARIDMKSSYKYHDKVLCQFHFRIDTQSCCCSLNWNLSKYELSNNFGSFMCCNRFFGGKVSKFHLFSKNSSQNQTKLFLIFIIIFFSKAYQKRKLIKCWMNFYWNVQRKKVAVLMT